MICRVSVLPKLYGSIAVLAGFFLLAAPAQAQRLSLADVLARVVSLEGTVTQLQADLAQETADRMAADAALQALFDALPAGSLPALQAQVNALESDVTVLQADSVPGLADYVSVVDRFRDLDGDGLDEAVPTVFVEGANLQVADGSGTTIPASGRPNGLGNLIVGYDEADPGAARCSLGNFGTQADCEFAGEIWAANQKNGSNNLVVGPEHFYAQSGGVVFGSRNILQGESASVSGGNRNIASGFASSVSGGQSNIASGNHSSVSGGFFNTASGSLSSVSGGIGNTASSSFASVSGGQNNNASEFASSVSGGKGNTASGFASSVSGGDDRTAPNTSNWAGGGLLEAF